MSRIRSVHPGIWTDVEFVSLSPFARLLFIGIWTEADDQGAFVWSPLQLKMRVLPADNIDAAELLSELTEAGRILPFEVGGKRYGAVRNFTKFQRPKKPNAVHPMTAEATAFASDGGELPPPSDADGSQMAGVKAGEVPNQFPTGGENLPQMEDGGGRMEEEPVGSSARKGARSQKRSSKTAILDDWVPDQFGDGTDCRRIIDGWPPGELETQIERFVAHHQAKGNRYESWQAAWKTWVLNSREFRRQSYDRTNRKADGSPASGYRGQPDRRDSFTRAIDDSLGLAGPDDVAGEDRRRDDGVAEGDFDGGPAHARLLR